MELQKKKDINNEKGLEEQKIKNLEDKKEKQKDNGKNKKEKEKLKKGKENDDLNNLKNPTPYQELQAEPSDENKSSQFMDEEGNVFNFDDLTDEEKMSILHQQIIFQKLQEEAEARGEQFDPQEYIAYLEQQAEEEELNMKKESNKLNKSF